MEPEKLKNNQMVVHWKYDDQLFGGIVQDIMSPTWQNELEVSVKSSIYSHDIKKERRNAIKTH